MEVPNWKTKRPSAGKWVSTQTTESPNDMHETRIDHVEQGRPVAKEYILIRAH